MRAFDLVGRRPEQGRERAGLRRVLAVQPGAEVALLPTGERGHSGRIAPRCAADSASVCSTESCRCAATSARSCDRTRSRRSRLRSARREATHGPRMSAAPMSAIVLADARSTKALRPRSCVTKYTAATTTRPRPAAMRTAALTPLDCRTQSESEASSSWRQMTITPTMAARTGSRTAVLTPRPATWRRIENPNADRDSRRSLEDLPGAHDGSTQAQPATSRRLQAGRTLRLGQRHEPPQQQVGDQPGPVEPGRHDETRPAPRTHARPGGRRSRPRRRRGSSARPDAQLV